MSRQVKIVLAVVVIAVVAVVLLPRLLLPPVEEAPRIRIGVIGPMKFLPGKHHWFGAVMARDEINAAGGVNVGGVMHKIELVKADDNSILSIPDAVSAMERLITVNRVNFVVGGFRTEAVLAQQEVMADHRVVFLSAGPVHPETNMRVAANFERYKYWFRVGAVNSIYLGQIMFSLVAMVADEIRQELGIVRPRVALMMERAIWADLVVAAAKEKFPALGMEVVGVWRPSAVATDVTAELTAIRAAGAHIIVTGYAGPAGIVVGRQWGELRIPAALVGMNAEAQSKGYWRATGGKAEYELTSNSIGNVVITERTIPFFNRFVDKTGEFPLYTAATHDTIFILKEAIERAGTIDSDVVVAKLQKTDFSGVGGRIVFTGRDSPYPHDLTWGPGYATGIGVQWRDGELVTVWPDGRAVLGDPRWEGLRYEGTIDYALPPWMVEYWRERLGGS
jgi:branched-chain amino acid transport system substrate-binding protein